MSANQVAKLVEGAEMIAEATGLSVAEIVSLVLSEPAQQIEETPDEWLREPALKKTQEG